MMSAHRAGLDAVPWTSTTGTRPAGTGCIMTSPPGNGGFKAERNAADLGVPDRRALELVGEGRRGLQLERHVAPPDLRRRRRVGRVHLDPSAQVPRGDARDTSSIRSESRHGYLEPRWDSLARLLGLGPLAGRLQLGGERRAEAVLTVAVEEAADLELAEGDEPRHAIAGPEERLVVHADLDPTEGQRPRARLEHDGRLLGSRQPLGQPKIVEVGRQPQPRVERVDARLIGPAEAERVRVHGGGEEVLGLLALHRVIEGQLGQHEEVFAAQSLPGAPERRQDQLGVRVEALPEPEACQQLLGIRARAIGREHARGQRAVHGLGVHVGDTDGCRARGRQQQDGNERA